MPIYVYECKQCQHTFEQLQKMADDPLLLCPKCDTMSLERIIQSPLHVSVTGGDNMTLGQLAEKNTDKFSDEHKRNLNIKHGRQEKPKPKLNWWDKSGNLTKKEVSQLSDKEKKKYIITGNKDGK